MRMQSGGRVHRVETEQLNVATHDDIENWAEGSNLESDLLLPPVHFTDGDHPPNATPTITHEHPLTTEVEMEFWMEGAEGAYVPSKRGR